MPRKTPITLKAEISALLAEGDFGSRILVLDDKDVVQLLKAAIKHEGSISAFAKRHGIERTYLSGILNRKRPVSAPLARALGLRRVFAPPDLAPPVA
jgi:hypothetical protein